MSNNDEQQRRREMRETFNALWEERKHEMTALFIKAEQRMDNFASDFRMLANEVQVIGKQAAATDSGVAGLYRETDDMKKTLRRMEDKIDKNATDMSMVVSDNARRDGKEVSDKDHAASRAAAIKGALGFLFGGGLITLYQAIKNYMNHK